MAREQIIDILKGHLQVEKDWHIPENEPLINALESVINLVDGIHKLYVEAETSYTGDEDDFYSLGELAMIKKVHELLEKEEEQ